MDPLHVVILIAAGAAGGFVAGLVGVGGGIVFAPVLFYFFQGIGVEAGLLAPTTVGTSLLCTLTVSVMSAWQHHLQRAVQWDVSLRVGGLSAVALYLVVAFATTQAWYDRVAFQLVFGSLLLAVAFRMIVEKRGASEETPQSDLGAASHSTLTLGGIGSAAGTIAALAGVGGGIVMVPAYHQILKLPMRTSVGTSSGAIVVISMIGVAVYAVTGWSGVSDAWMLGYVDLAAGLVLGIPGLAGAAIGARLAHRLPRQSLRAAFALIASIVAVRMLLSALSGI